MLIQNCYVPGIVLRMQYSVLSCNVYSLISKIFIEHLLCATPFSKQKDSAVNCDVDIVVLAEQVQKLRLREVT